MCFNCCSIKSSKHWKKPSNNIENKPFIDQYNWNEIDFPLHSKDWKKLEQINKRIALNILFVSYNTKRLDKTCIQIKT